VNDTAAAAAADDGDDDAMRRCNPGCDNVNDEISRR